MPFQHDPPYGLGVRITVTPGAAAMNPNATVLHVYNKRNRVPDACLEPSAARMRGHMQDGMLDRAPIT